MLLEVGRIGRPHGLGGEVSVLLSTDRTERVAPGAQLDTDRGPMVVRTARPHGGRWLVHFEGVDDRTDAEELRGLRLRAEAVDEPGALWVHELVGAVVSEVDGTERGRVEAVQDNPAADLLVLDDGALVPVVFIVEHEPGRRVVIDPPPGLFEL